MGGFFTYGRVLRDAIIRHDGLKLPQGQDQEFEDILPWSPATSCGFLLQRRLQRHPAPSLQRPLCCVAGLRRLPCCVAGVLDDLPPATFPNATSIPGTVWKKAKTFSVIRYKVRKSWQLALHQHHLSLEDQRGCGFFLWHDPELSERSKIIINELKMNNKKLKLEINELKKGTSYEGTGDYNDVLDDGNNNHVIMQLRDEICSLNRKFRIAIAVVVCIWIVMMSMWLM
ncbi:hypothetical protein ZIOFF_016470 [Zingiber officinale]|uniref:Uncharacterized protein n=1 Tax=Zingiber officinale TaxID=94328 RepID=A0A8J5LQY2_ZINOF|nr:hypothetical protein ZIOFF_016470 [Zingiber officinale]